MLYRPPLGGYCDGADEHRGVDGLRGVVDELGGRLRRPAGRCRCRSPATAPGRARRAPPGRAARSVPVDVVVEDGLALPERVEPGAGDVALDGADLQRPALAPGCRAGSASPTTQDAPTTAATRRPAGTSAQPARGEQDPGEQHADRHDDAASAAACRRARRTPRAASPPARRRGGPTGSPPNGHVGGSSSVATHRTVNTTTCRPALRHTALPRRAQAHAAPNSATYSGLEGAQREPGHLADGVVGPGDQRDEERQTPERARRGRSSARCRGAAPGRAGRRRRRPRPTSPVRGTRGG